MDSVKSEEDPGAGGSAERYYCPYPNCKRSFAELWRLKVHYRAPPDIRGSGKERGHGTELTHCPKCGKGLKPGKHHVGCSGGKAGPRQNKRSRLAAASTAGMGMEGMQANVYTLQMQYGQAATNSVTPQLGAGFQQQQQYLTQQYQPDMSAGMYAGQVAATQHMTGSLPPQQLNPGQQQQSPALSMGILPDQLTNGGGAAMGGSMLTSTGGPAPDAGMVAGGTQGFYQQQPMQQQMSLDSMQPLQSMQSGGQLQDSLAVHGAAGFGMTASAAFIQNQAQQQQQQHQAMQADVSLYAAAPGADAAGVATAGMMLPPQPVQMQQAVPGMAQQGVQVQPQQQHSPQLVPGQLQLSSAGSGALLQQQHHQQPHMAQAQQQLPQLVMVLPQQQLLSPTGVPQQQQAQVQVQAETMGAPAQVGVMAQTMAPAGSGSLTSTTTSMQMPASSGAFAQHQTLQVSTAPQQQQQVVAQPAHGQQEQQMAPPPPPPLQHQISSNLFDEIDGGFDFTQPPSPPPLPADFPAASGTLFNFAQFSQKLPAAAPPSQQMAMMPRGMEQELPPSIDELWTPEATYDHHSDGDLMQLLFGAPEQPPTMATIHLHHFLDDDACSSPGLLAGILGGSMDDLQGAGGQAAGAAGGDGGAQARGGGAAGAGAAAGGVAVQGSSAMVAPAMPPPQQLPQAAADAAFIQQPQQGGQPQQQHQQQQPAAFVPTGVKMEQQPQQMGGVAMILAQQPDHHQQQQHLMGGMQQPQQLQQQDFMQQSYHMAHHQPQQQQLYSTIAMPINGLNGLNGMNGAHCIAPVGGNGMQLPNGQCGSAALQVHMSMQLNVQHPELTAGGPGAAGMVGIKGEDEQALRMQQKAAVAAATLPGAMASRAN